MVVEDSSVWNDYEEDHYGPMDTPDNQMEYPEGFLWTCCDRRATE